MAMAHHYESSVTLAASPETASVHRSAAAGIGRWLGKLFGNAYARWCTKRMASDAAAAFRADVQVAAGDRAHPRITEDMTRKES